MDVDGPRRGTRDNGLRCAGYVPVADLDPRIVDGLLEALRDHGIAAYGGPTPGASGGYMEVRLPNRPLDRLWVDQAQQARAREVIARELEDEESAPTPPAASPATPPAGAPAASPATPPVGEPAAFAAGESAGELGVPTAGAPSVPATGSAGAAGSGGAGGPTDPADIDFDAAWQQVLVSLQSTPGGPAPQWPATTGGGGGDRPAPAALDPGDDLDELDDPDDPADSAHFEPPAPPPLPRLRPVTLAAVVAIVLGMLVLVTDFAGGDLDVVAYLAVFGGFASLVWNMRQGPPTDSGWDDGAVV